MTAAEMRPVDARRGLRDVARRVEENSRMIAQAAAAAQTAADAGKSAAEAAKKAADLVAARQTRASNIVAVPAVLTVLTSVARDIAVTWSSPWPDTDYVILPWVESGASLLGKIAVQVKSKTKEGCVLTVTTTAVLATDAASVRALSVRA